MLIRLVNYQVQDTSLTLFTPTFSREIMHSWLLPRIFYLHREMVIAKNWVHVTIVMSWWIITFDVSGIHHCNSMGVRYSVDWIVCGNVKIAIAVGEQYEYIDKCCQNKMSAEQEFLVNKASELYWLKEMNQAITTSCCFYWLEGENKFHHKWGGVYWRNWWKCLGSLSSMSKSYLYLSMYDTIVQGKTKNPIMCKRYDSPKKKWRQ